MRWDIKPTYVILCCLLLLLTTAKAQQSDLQTLDRYIDKLQDKNQAMGSFSIYKEGKQVYSRAFGYASIGSKTPADTSTVYKIGSISKLITATLILIAVDEGLISLSDKLSLYFPRIPNADKITIEHLLRHQSGIHNFGKDEKYGSVAPQTTKEIIDVMAAAVIDFEPGSRTEYNNANFLVLSLILEKVYNKPFANILNEKIAKPLQLKSLYYGEAPEKAGNEADSYYWKRGWRLNSQSSSTPIYGVGGIKATPNDLNLFLTQLFSGKIISEELLEAMLVFKDNMGLGVFRYPFYYRICYGHSGSIGTFQSLAAYFPYEEVAFTLCLNGERKDINELAKDLLVLYFDSE